jgi:hypothetical protein
LRVACAPSPSRLAGDSAIYISGRLALAGGSMSLRTINVPDKRLTIAAVRKMLDTSFERMFPGTIPTLGRQALRDVESMFEGRYLDYQANDTPYHNLAHTLRVLVCFNDIMEGRHNAGIEPHLTARQHELAAIAVMFHDTGYLKLRADRTGTGAKYTFTHVLRSCACASSHLPALGISLAELDSVLAMIRCTAFTQGSRHFQFQEPIEGIAGCAVATADYLAQMAAPDYPESLEKLFAEIEESDNYAQVPPRQRRYRTHAELVADTPAFWQSFVLPRLERELLGVYRFLATPYPDGRNPYIDAVEANIEKIKNLKT